MKINNVLLGYLIITFILIDYLLIVHGIGKLLNLSFKEITEAISPLISLGGIFVAAFIAIKVMRENHKHNIPLENAKTKKELSLISKKYEDSDILTQQRVERTLNTLTLTTRGYGLGISSYNDLKKIGKEFLLVEINEIIEVCKEVRRYDFYAFEDRQIETIKLCDELVKEAKNIQIQLVSKDLPSAAYISNKFRKMNINLHEYFEESKYVKVEDEKINTLF